MVTAVWLSAAVENTWLFLVGNGRVALDQLGEDAAQRFDAEGQRRDVQQQHVLDVAFEHAALDGGADGDHFIGIHAAMRFFPEKVFHDLDDFRHAGHSADEHDFIDVPGRHAGVGQGFPAGFDRPLDQVVHQLFQPARGSAWSPCVWARWHRP